MKKLNIAYFGTPYFSARFLEKCLTDSTVNQLTEIKFVVTQSDKPVGRKQIMTPSPVKEMARKYEIPIKFQIINSKSQINLKFKTSNSKRSKHLDFDNSNLFRISSLEFRNLLKDIDLALLFAYGEIIPEQLLTLPRYGFWCIHPSLLPKYRGASPIAFPILLGDKKTGVTIFKMDEKIDRGPIIAQETLPIDPTDRRPDLELKLTDLAFTIFKKLITELTSLRVHELKTSEQNHKQALYTRMLTKDDGFIALSTLIKSLKNEPLTQEELPKIVKEYYLKNSKLQITRNKQITNHKTQDIKSLKFEKSNIGNSPEIIFNLFRGLYPWPGIWTKIEPTRLRSEAGKPSRLNEKRLKITDMEMVNEKLILKKVQLEGKKEVDFKTFNNAYKIF